MENERRKFLRLDTSVNIAYKHSSLTKDETVSLSKNISRSGVCITTNEELKESDLIDLKIALNADQPVIAALGRVVWCKETDTGDPFGEKKFEVGIEFKKINEQEIYRLISYIYKQLKEKK